MGKCSDSTQDIVTNLDNEETIIKETEEAVLVIPNRLTQSAYSILKKKNAVAKPFHLEGRYGSRTHRIDESHMGLPLILSEDKLLALADCCNPGDDDDLHKLLRATEDVSIVTKPFVPSNRARAPPEVNISMSSRQFTKIICLDPLLVISFVIFTHIQYRYFSFIFTDRCPDSPGKNVQYKWEINNEC